MRRVLVARSVALPALAAAHPLGNFTVNRYSALRVEVRSLSVRYVVDMAEIPAYQEIAAIDRNGNGVLDTDERDSYLARRPADRMTELINIHQPLGLGLVLSSLLVAAMLGALHALGPGHGKTIVGAYLIGARGTARHALFLGLMVTATHTLGVYLLGFATWIASAGVVPSASSLGSACSRGCS